MKAEKEHSDNPAKRFLVAVTLLACVVNIACWRSVEPVLTDSTEYLHGALRIFSGNGFESIYGGPQDAYTPGLPLAIGVLNLLIRDPILSARLVVLLCSVCSVIPLVLIATRLFGRNAGIATGMVYALLPIRVQLSSVILTEPVFLFFVLLGTWLWLRECDQHSWARAAVMGAVFGYSYLVRPEGLVIAFVLFAFAFVPRWFGPVPRIRNVLVALIALALIASPYIIYLRSVTGRWTLGNKRFTYSYCQWESKGTTYVSTYRLNKEGTEIDWGGYRESAVQCMRRAAKNALVERREVSLQIGKFLSAVLLLGFALELYRRNVVLLRAVPVLVALGFPLLYLPLLYPEARFVFTGVTGVLMLACWQLVKRFKADWADGSRSWFAGVTMWIPLVIVCVYLAAGSRSMFLVNRQPTDYSVIGSWVSELVSANQSVLTFRPQIAFYAGRRPIRLPSDEIHKVIRYARLKRGDYMLLLREDRLWYEKSGELAKGISEGLLRPAGELALSGQPAAWLYQIEQRGH